MAPKSSTQVENALLAGGVSQAELDEWKVKHGKVQIIKVKLSANETVTGYFRKPDRPILANCVNLSSTGQLFEAKEFLWNNSWLGGDAAIKTNQDAAISGQNALWKCFSFFGSGGSDLLSIKNPLSKKQGKDILRKANALIRYHLKIDPDELSDDKFSEIWQGLRWALEFESKRFSLKEGQDTIRF